MVKAYFRSGSISFKENFFFGYCLCTNKIHFIIGYGENIHPAIKMQGTLSECFFYCIKYSYVVGDATNNGKILF